MGLTPAPEPAAGQFRREALYCYPYWPSETGFRVVPVAVKQGEVFVWHTHRGEPDVVYRGIGHRRHGRCKPYQAWAETV